MTTLNCDFTVNEPNVLDIVNKTSASEELG